MEAFVFFHQPVSDASASKLEAKAIELVNRGIEKLTVVINSTGGNSFAGMGAYHTLKSLPIEVNTHAHGVCGSIAANIYLAGKKRTIAKSTAVILHATTFSDGPLQGMVSPYTEVVTEPFKSVAGWCDLIKERFFLPSEQYLMPDEAVELNFAHEVSDLQIPSDAEIHHIA